MTTDLQRLAAELAALTEEEQQEVRFEASSPRRGQTIVFLIGAVENDTAERVQAHLNSRGPGNEDSYADIVKKNDGKATGGVTWEHIDTSVGK